VGPDPNAHGAAPRGGGRSGRKQRVAVFPASERCVHAVVHRQRALRRSQGVVQAAANFVRCCRSVGVTINELPNAPEDASLRQLVHQRGDWLGAEYDYAASSVAKSMKKLAASWGRRAEWTHRQYAAHMGLLFFTASVLRSPLASFYEAIKQLRLRSAALSHEDSLLEQAGAHVAGRVRVPHAVDGPCQCQRVDEIPLFVPRPPVPDH
jgi:hypothetical protein